MPSDGAYKVENYSVLNNLKDTKNSWCRIGNGGKLHAMLLTSSYTPDYKNDKFVSDIVTYELPSTDNYGRVGIDNSAFFINSSDGSFSITCDSIIFENGGGYTFGYCVVYEETDPSDDTQNRIVSIIEVKDDTGNPSTDTVTGTYIIRLSNNSIAYNEINRECSNG